ncbi:gp6 domain containing protein [uncultured Caudovirales phage]|uniref:Gp6 domain containing protein n=1 Tax=uncultured Caudovirales phage TaxID=2100421 RepID=A0A6J7WHN3_9CAUD|nr:gp6 domain containing protein [uncultured Caudovirales phage]
MSVNDYQQGAPFGAQTRNPFNYVKAEQIGRDSVTPWLTLEEITQQLNLFGDESQDSYLSGLEVATRQAIEDYLGMSIFSLSYRVWYGSESLAASPLCLDLPEVSQNFYPSQAGVQIDEVGYYNDSFPPVYTVIASSNYYYDPSGNKVILNSLPTSINSVMTAPIMVTYSTAANPLSAYPVIKQAGLLLLTHLYNNRSNTTDNLLREIPFGVASLLRNYKPLIM